MKLVKTLISFCSVSAITLVLSTPVYALPDPAAPSYIPDSVTSDTQQTLITELSEPEMFDMEVLVTYELPQPEPVTETVEEESLKQPVVTEPEPVNNTIPEMSFVSQTGNAFVDAALAQLGTIQDCTALVEKALRAVGYEVGDLAPMQFAQYGTQVNPNDAQFGDIIMRDGHVAIYTGDGVNHSAIHGGWNGGNTVQSVWESNPHEYSVIVRLP